MNQQYRITGASGRLGTAIQATVRASDTRVLLPRSREALDISDDISIAAYLAIDKQSPLINVAAYTNVRGASANQDLCWRANVLGPALLAKYCSESDTPLLHVSSDFVFSGRDQPEPFTEDSVTRPCNYYGFTKLQGEYEIWRRMQDWPSWKFWIVRTAGLFGRPDVDPLSFPSRIAAQLRNGDRTVEVVSDVYTNICYAPELARAILWMLDNRDEWSQATGPIVPPGIYHVVNSGAASWYQVAQRIALRVGGASKLRPISIKEYATKHGIPQSLSPGYSVIESSKYLECGAPKLRNWERAIDDWCEQL